MQESLVHAEFQYAAQSVVLMMTAIVLPLMLALAMTFWCYVVRSLKLRRATMRNIAYTIRQHENNSNYYRLQPSPLYSRSRR